MIRLILILTLLATGATAASAQSRRPSHCIAIADAAPGLEYLHKASFRDPLPEHTVRISYIAHASFLIQTPAGISAVTDYTGYIGTTNLIPDVVTMNHAHETHWTPSPDPAIRHVLQGWGDEFGQGITHLLEIGDMAVRNVSTNIRSYGGVEPAGNSIFVFEVADLCIGHLGHLHHDLTDAHYAAVGRLDVVMIPVDGGMTQSLANVSEIARRLYSSIILPMHRHSTPLSAFTARMGEGFALDFRDERSFSVSLRSLPRRPTIVVLKGV